MQRKYYSRVGRYLKKESAAESRIEKLLTTTVLTAVAPWVSRTRYGHLLPADPPEIYMYVIGR